MTENLSNATNTAYTVVGIFTLVISQVIIGVVWINKRFQYQRDEFYKLLSKNKETCATVKERVGILEVREDANIKKLDILDSKVGGIEDTLMKMKLDAKETELTLLGAIHMLKGDRE